MGKTTSAERMRKLRQKRQEDPEFDKEKFKEKERKRINKIRQKNRLKRTSKDVEESKTYERLRKRKQREIKRKKDKVDGRRVSNIKNGRRRREEQKVKDKNEISNLKLKVKLFTNENRRLKRKLNDSCASSDSSILNSVSPSAKKRAKKRLSLSGPSNTLKQKLRLDRVKWGEERSSELENLVVEFLCRDDNSIVTPDKKHAKKGIRYRCESLKELHAKFLVDHDTECSYAQFTRYVPNYILKPKPEDWGTCLCMVCLNPELKLEAAKRNIPGISLTLDMVKDGGYSKEIEKVCIAIKECTKVFNYLEWSKEKADNTKTTSYHSKKNALSCSGDKFAKVFLKDMENLYSHAINFKSQYSRIRKLKELVKDPESKAKLMRIDWSENVELYQTRQEKSQYYTTLSASVNTAVLYDSDGVKSFGTISDVKSHMAEATWASLHKIFEYIDFSSTNHFYIASDSPGSQYRNKKNVFLMKGWAKQSGINLTWVFTETGHGKGPMDGVGRGIKQTVHDTIAYNPNAVIRNTEQLLNHLPVMPKIFINTYNKDDVEIQKNKLPEIYEVESEGVGVSKVHEIYCEKEDDKKVMWKELSSDDQFIKVKLLERQRIVKKGSVNQDESVNEEESSSQEISTEESDHEENLNEENEKGVNQIQEISIDDKEIGKFYAVFFDEGLYWGRLTKVFYEDVDCDEPTSAEFNFLHYLCGFWDFPKKKEDRSIINIMYVIYGPCIPKVTTKNGYQFHEDDLVQKKFNALKKRK